MKTKILLLGVIVAAFTYSTFAGDLFLSPRAQGNQTKVVSGMNNDVNSALACRKMMTGSPKAVVAYADNPSRQDCNAMTVADAK